MATTTVRVLKAGEGESTSGLTTTDRFMIDGKDTEGRFSLVQHIFGPKVLAAPMHRHSREDEYTYVLKGRIGAILDGEECEGGPGDLIFKPRNQWHTFWNAGDEPAEVLEIISSAGLEELFREFGRMSGAPDSQTLIEMAGRYGCEIDLEATFPVIERHSLKF